MDKRATEEDEAKKKIFLAVAGVAGVAGSSGSCRGERSRSSWCGKHDKVAEQPPAWMISSGNEAYMCLLSLESVQGASGGAASASVIPEGGTR